MEILGLVPEILCFRDSGKPETETPGLRMTSSSSSSITLSSFLLPLMLVLAESLRFAVACPPFPLIRSIRLPKDDERSCRGLEPEVVVEPRRVACSKGEREAGELGPEATTGTSRIGVDCRSTAETGMGSEWTIFSGPRFCDIVERQIK